MSLYERDVYIMISTEYIGKALEELVYLSETENNSKGVAK